MWRGISKTVPVRGWWCDHCGEAVLDSGALVLRESVYDELQAEARGMSEDPSPLEQIDAAIDPMSERVIQIDLEESIRQSWRGVESRVTVTLLPDEYVIGIACRSPMIRGLSMQIYLDNVDFPRELHDEVFSHWCEPKTFLAERDHWCPLDLVRAAWLCVRREEDNAIGGLMELLVVRDDAQRKGQTR